MISIKRAVAFAIITAFTIFATLLYAWLPEPQNRESLNFSAKRAADDIKEISIEPHSLDHPEARDRVRDYLKTRLDEAGFRTEIEFYDTIGNIYAYLSPVDNDSLNGSYLLLMAHLDSRHAYTVNGKVHYSLGAADDGYGLASIIELAANSLKYHEYWSQGLKILFTDGEEKNLYGIKAALKNRGDFFKDVGLIINIEARGVKGPAVLFETSPGNRELVKLFSKSSHPSGYSLSSFVYGILPNYTDFSLIKDDYPGMNFAVIDNLDYYHTELDNYENISLSSLQHYGVQIAPIIEEYLVNSKYSDNKYLFANRDLVYFTIPFAGLFTFSRWGYFLLNISFAFLLLFKVIWLRKSGGLSLNRLVRTMATMLSVLILISFFTFALSFILSLINGVDYKLIGLAHIKFDNLLAILAFAATIIFISIAYSVLSYNRRVSYVEFHISAEILCMFFSGIFLIFSGENFFLFIPFLFSMISGLFINFKYGWIVFGAFLFISLMTVLPFLHLIYMALYSGALFLPLTIFSLIWFMFFPHIHRLSIKLAK